MLGEPRDSSGRPRAPQRLATADLLRELGARAAAGGRHRTMLLVVALHRSDRLQALAQDPTNRFVLAEVARRVGSVLRPSDRYSFATPDELWVMLADLPGESLGELAARTMRESLARPIPLAREDGTPAVVRLRPAVGAAWAGESSTADPMALLASASEAAAEACNPDTPVVVSRVGDDDAWMQRNRLEQELRQALQNNDLDVFFQPQVRLDTGACVGAEALVRWTRPDGTLVNPALIASICEERGLMGALTQFVLNTALRHAMLWQSQGLDLGVTVNLTASTLADPAFPSLIGHALSTWGVAPARLTLDLTENAIAQNERSALEFMGQLRATGCGISLDDFGTGRSAFSYLRRFPFTALTIDRSFVRTMELDQGDRRIVKALIDLARTFGLETVAEGVESPEAAATLASLGCDAAQGYLFSRALAPTEFARWCRAHAETVTQAGSAGSR